MRLWRISDFADLSGDGGLYARGRWHSQGRKIVYLSEQPASALVETLAHLEIEEADIPSHYQLLAIDVPDGTSVKSIDPKHYPTIGGCYPRLLVCAATPG